MKSFEQYKRLVKILFSIVILFLEVAVYGLFWIQYYNVILESPFWRRGNWLMIALYAVLLLLLLKTYGGLKIGHLKRSNLIISQVLSVCMVNGMTYIQISLLDKELQDLKVISAMTLIDIILIVAWVFFFQWLYMKIFPPRKMLFVYGDLPSTHLIGKINQREDKYYLAGAIHIEKGIPFIMSMISKEGYDAVIIGDIPSHARNQMMKSCFQQAIRTYTVPKISDILLRSSTELNIFDSPLLLSRNDGLLIEQKVAKRMLDICISTIGLVLSAPFFAVIAILIKFTDGGPVFYKQKRLTLNGKVFELYKFRTMVQNAEQNSGARLASKNDERVLPVGKFLRATRLDEMPQFWNILKGDMSVVGPRPERPELAAAIEKVIPEFAYRLKMKAGLTGYAQVYGKYNTTSYDKLKLDLTYIRNYSIWLDLRLILMTPKIMLLKESTEGIEEDMAISISELASYQENKTENN